MLGLILSGFLMSAGGVAGQHAANTVWEKFMRENPKAAKELPKVFTRWLQASLLILGHEIDVTGEFDAETERQVKMFQAKHGMSLIDGIAGPRTLEVLSGELTKQALATVEEKNV
jgi:murein L,D-transpeptidase YcbB/YkuD